jgi:hypothetical protein
VCVSCVWREDWTSECVCSCGGVSWSMYEEECARVRQLCVEGGLNLIVCVACVCGEGASVFTYVGQS